MNSVTGNKKITIIALDSTWREARKMRRHKLIAKLPSVQLQQHSIDNHVSLFVARQKSHIVERICTLEAVALLLKETSMIKEKFVGDSEDADAALSQIENINTLVSVLFSNMQLAMGALLYQSGNLGKTNFKREWHYPNLQLKQAETE